MRYLVLLVDREKAKLFTVFLGFIEDYKEFTTDHVPQKVKAKKIDFGRDDKISRHIEGHLDKHLKSVAQITKEFVRGKKINFILIGGHKELFAKVKRHLLYPLNKKKLGEFVTELNIPLDRIFIRCEKAAKDVMSKYKTV